jgi:hypothetical protein
MTEPSSELPLEEPFKPALRLDSPFAEGAFHDADRFCLQCNERLYASGLAQCGRCGLQYDGGNLDTFRTKPMFLRWKFWFPGVMTAIVCGVVSYAICLQAGDLGFALFGAVPLSMGAILGYSTRVGQLGAWAVVLLLSLTVVATVVGLVTIGAAGVFCGLTLAAIFILPVAAGFIFGVGAGALVRVLLANSQWDQRWFLPLIGFIAFPYFVQLVESATRGPLGESVVTTRLSIHSTPQEAWNAIMFYEEVEHEAPWLLKLSLPRPVRSHGSKGNVGDVVRCEYERGYIVKRITEVEPGRRLAFEVLEQKLFKERDLMLQDGSFEITPRDDGRLDLVLTTRYERRLAPRWLWETTEHQVLHTLHGHVLEGMRRKILQDRASPDAPREQPYRRDTSPAPAAT